MSAQILLFPAQRIRRLTCPGAVSPDLMLIGMTKKLPRVEYNLSVKLLYEVCDGIPQQGIIKKPKR